MEALRIISTYVENTPVQEFYGFCAKDHLHIRGEHKLHGFTLTTVYRIISTYVENTQKVGKIANRLGDHLHIRGEHHCVPISSLWDKGSSPHTWRTRDLSRNSLTCIRIISTYVENTVRALVIRSLS